MSYTNPNVYSIHHKIRLNPLKDDNSRSPSKLSYINHGIILPVIINLNKTLKSLGRRCAIEIDGIAVKEIGKVGAR